MHHALVALHAGLGEIGAFAFLWAFVELLSPDSRRVTRARRAALAGTAFFVLSWITGGYYYVVDYGPEVKPAILEGPMAYAHFIFMEAKEHVFLFLPILGFYAYSVLAGPEKVIIEDSDLRRALLALCAVIFLTAVSMVGAGYVISMGFRMAMQSTVGIGE